MKIVNFSILKYLEHLSELERRESFLIMSKHDGSFLPFTVGNCKFHVNEDHPCIHVRSPNGDLVDSYNPLSDKGMDEVILYLKNISRNKKVNEILC